MYVGKITINEKEYPAALTMRAIKEIGRRFGDMETMNNIITGEGSNESEIMEALMGAVEILLNGGRDYMEANKKETEKPPIDQLDVLIGIDDIEQLVTEVYTTINGSSKREVKVKTDPNAEATQNE